MKKAVSLIVTAAMVLLAGIVAYSADAAAGKEVYTKEKCQMCHSVAGVGGKMSKLDGVGAKLKTDDLKKWIKTPKAMKADSKMKAYPNIADKDLDDLVAYLLTLK
ncbi:MAG TPA: cytochrome c [Acidobacteriota bacterium]|nr:cytochrome c [Acidobacteriota bacterium]